MSSESRFTLSSLTLAQPRGSERLHSRGFALSTKLTSLLVIVGLWRVLLSDLVPAVLSGLTRATVDSAIHALLLLGLAVLLWSRSKPVIATPGGLVVGSGKKQRHIAWTRVIDVREVPWLRFSPPWYPLMWQVDLDRDERFDFCGVRNARDIVIEYVKRAETAAELPNS